MEEKKYYTLEQVAAMTELSERTVRNYLRLGVLHGEKVDGAWRFSEEAFEAFLEQDMVRQSLNAKTLGIIHDFLLQTEKPSPAVCAVPIFALRLTTSSTPASPVPSYCAACSACAMVSSSTLLPNCSIRSAARAHSSSTLPLPVFS